MLRSGATSQSSILGALVAMFCWKMARLYNWVTNPVKKPGGIEREPGLINQTPTMDFGEEDEKGPDKKDVPVPQAAVRHKILIKKLNLPAF